MLPEPTDIPGAEVPGGVPAEVPGDPPSAGVPAGLELARRALASAKAEAARRGQRPGVGPGGSGPDADAGAGGTERRRGGRTRDQRSGAHPDARDPQTLGSAVRRLLADRGWHTQVSVGGVLGRWAEVVGPELAAHCTPEGLTDGELSIRADSTAWATQLRLLAPQLADRLNAAAGAGTVRRVRVLGPGGPSWRRGPRAVMGRGPRDTYG